MQRRRLNGIAENKVKEIIRGARVLLRQAGLEAKWWPYAVRTYCFHHNCQDRDGVSPYETRFGKPMEGVDLRPFGCFVPSSVKCISPLPVVKRSELSSYFSALNHEKIRSYILGHIPSWVNVSFDLVKESSDLFLFDGRIPIFLRGGSLAIRSVCRGLDGL